MTNIRLRTRPRAHRPERKSPPSAPRRAAPRRIETQARPVTGTVFHARATPLKDENGACRRGEASRAVSWEWIRMLCPVPRPPFFDPFRRTQSSLADMTLSA